MNMDLLKRYRDDHEYGFISISGGDPFTSKHFSIPKPIKGLCDMDDLFEELSKKYTPEKEEGVVLYDLETIGYPTIVKTRSSKVSSETKPHLAYLTYFGGF